jgi:hypothetical protein
MAIDYRTQKILLTGKIDDELQDYLLWQCHHSNSLYNCTLWEIRQSHFADCPTYQYFDQNDCYRSAFQDRLVKASYADLCKQLPTARLKNRIKELAESVGIIFTETEEAYSSKSSFLDNDLVPKYGEKPKGYKFSGRRVKRGLYRSAKGILVNADLNGAGSILRKVAIQLAINLTEVGKAALTLPKRYTLSCLRKVYRKRCEAVLLAPVATSA